MGISDWSSDVCSTDLRQIAKVASARGIVRWGDGNAMKRSLLQIFAMPLVLLILTASGLIVGLLGQGWWDMAAIVALGVALSAILLWIARWYGAPGMHTALRDRVQTGARKSVGVGEGVDIG